jgi:hypothetical protein
MSTGTFGLLPAGLGAGVSGPPERGVAKKLLLDSISVSL